MTDFSIEIKEISKRTSMVTSEAANAGAVALKNFIIVIDPLMYPSQSKKFREHLEKKFNLPVKYLFITHYHGDHIYGVSTFKDVEIFGSKILTKVVKKKMDTEWNQETLERWKKEHPELKKEVENMQFILPEAKIDGKYSIKDENDIVDFYHVGGHTSCSAYAYYPKDKILFAGDLMFAEYWPWAGDDTCDPEKWMKAYEDMLKLDIEYVIPGHGPVVGVEEIRKQLDFMKELKSALLKAIEEGKEHKDVEIPEFYKAGEDWVIPKSIEHLHKFYSNYKNK